MTPLRTFDEFYNRLCDIEERETSWVDQDYAEEIADKKWKLFKEKRIEEMKKEMKKSKMKSSPRMNYLERRRLKYRELDLRRKLLHRIGKYELEEGEIFE